MKGFNERDRTKELIGRRFFKLKVIDFYGTSTKHQLVWVCRCDCGKITLAETTWLKLKRKKSCGCLKPKKLKNLSI